MNVAAMNRHIPAITRIDVRRRVPISKRLAEKIGNAKRPATSESFPVNKDGKDRLNTLSLISRTNIDTKKAGWKRFEPRDRTTSGGVAFNRSYPTFEIGRSSCEGNGIFVG